MDPINFTDILLAAIGFLIVFTLNGIKSEIKEVKTSMKDLTKQLVDIDRRVVAVEVQCGVNHHRRATDIQDGQ